MLTIILFAAYGVYGWLHGRDAYKGTGSYYPSATVSALIGLAIGFVAIVVGTLLASGMFVISTFVSAIPLFAYIIHRRWKDSTILNDY